MDSPYHKYFNTNYVPSVDEARHIQSILKHSHEEISDIDSQVHNLQQQLVIFQEQRAKMQIFYVQHQALLSPMRRMPRDILEEIFLACLPTDRNPCMSAKDAPVLLTRICSSWRHVALSTPRIWARIHIALPVMKLEEYYRRDKVSLEVEDLIKEQVLVNRVLKLRETVVSEWLGRALACPLLISIYEPYEPGIRVWDVSRNVQVTFNTIFHDIRKSRLSLIRNTIIPHFNRLLDLDICVVNDTLGGILDVGLKAEDLPVLQSLHVTEQNTEAISRYLEVSDSWGNDIAALMSLCTTTATLTSFPFRDSDIPSLSVCAWGQLTELNVDFEGYNAAASVLRCCRSLVTLKLLVTRDTELKDTEEIHLPYLTTLTIYLSITSSGVAFSQALYLPAIKSLGFQVYFPDNSLGKESVLDVFKSLLRASDDFCALTIHGSDWATTYTDLIQFLMITPTLCSLKISSQYTGTYRWRPLPPVIFQTPKFRNIINDNLLHALESTEKRASDIICPKLEEFCCDYSIITNVTENGLKTFINSRRSDPRVSHLRRVSVFIEHLKQETASDDNKLSLGSGSAVYFRRPLITSYSPFDGFEDEGNQTLPSDYYTEL